VLPELLAQLKRSFAVAAAAAAAGVASSSSRCRKQQQHPPLTTTTPSSPPINLQMYKRHKLLKFRCNRYFFVESINTFIPVPEVPKVRRLRPPGLPSSPAPALKPSPCSPSSCELRHSARHTLLPAAACYTQSWPWLTRAGAKSRWLAR
jgi:hypothetical protein